MATVLYRLDLFNSLSYSQVKKKQPWLVLSGARKNLKCIVTVSMSEKLISDSGKAKLSCIPNVYVEKVIKPFRSTLIMHCICQNNTCKQIYWVDSTYMAFWNDSTNLFEFTSLTIQMLETVILLNLIASLASQIFIKNWQHFLPKCPVSTIECTSQLTVGTDRCRVSSMMSNSRKVQCWHFVVTINA